MLDPQPQNILLLLHNNSNIINHNISSGVLDFSVLPSQMRSLNLLRLVLLNLLTEFIYFTFRSDAGLENQDQLVGPLF